MSPVRTIVLRYLKTRPVASVALFSVAAGVAAMIILVSLMDGVLGFLRDHYRGTEGDLVIRHRSAPALGNDHFEMVKQEVRAAGRGDGGPPPAAQVSGADAWTRVAELENVLAEQSLHQARVLARLTEEVTELSSRIEELERVVRQLALVVAAPAPDE